MVCGAREHPFLSQSMCVQRANKKGSTLVGGAWVCLTCVERGSGQLVSMLPTVSASTHCVGRLIRTGAMSWREKSTGGRMLLLSSPGAAPKGRGTNEERQGWGPVSQFSLSTSQHCDLPLCASARPAQAMLLSTEKEEPPIRWQRYSPMKAEPKAWVPNIHVGAGRMVGER